MALDPAADPDRYDATREAPAEPTLPGLLGAGAHEDERSNLTWAFGLAGVVGFLLLVTLLVRLGNGG